MIRARRLAILLGVCAAVGVAGTHASAYWTGFNHPAPGVGSAGATSVNQGATPTVALAGGNTSVAVNWSATTLTNGQAVSGYIVKRYNALTEAVQTTLSGCSGTITATGCTENAVPAGDWYYTVTPAIGTNWRGQESARSSVIATATSSLDFLQPITSPEVVRAGPAGLDSGDVDHDGDIDIVTSALFALTTSVLTNNGVGDFRETTVGSNVASIDVALANFDSDNNIDLVILYPGSPPGGGLLAIFKGGGDGSFIFQAAQPNAVVNTDVRSATLVTGNFNGDAIDDVAVVASKSDPLTQTGTVSTFLGNPAGNDAFAAATPAQTLNAQLGAYDVVHADFNGGAADLVVSNYNSNSITFLAGNGTGFDAPTHIPVGGRIFFMDTARVNAGSDLDIVATLRDSSPSAIRTLLGNGAGDFPTKTTTTAATPTTGTVPQGIVAKDFDNDTDVDVALANAGWANVSVLTNDGAGAFTIVPTSPETVPSVPGSFPFELTSADFDGNGFNDLATGDVFSSNPGTVGILLNQSGYHANLSISQTDSPDPVAASRDVTYTLTVANASLSTPSVVKSTDTLPAGATFNAAASSPSCSAVGTSPVVVTCAFGAVAKGSPVSRQVVATMGPTMPASISNIATVAGNLADPTPANNTSTATTAVTPDTQAPTQSLSLTSPVSAYLTGTTLYYKANGAGSFRLVDTVSDAGTGPASATYPAIATTGWTHGAETVTTPSGGPYTSAAFSWTASPSIPAGYSVSGADKAGNTTSSALTFVADTTAPADGSVTYTDGVVNSLSVPVSTSNGTDGQSGVDASTGILKRSQANLDTLTEACGTFGAFDTTITLSGGADTTVTSGHCYQYEHRVSDRVGNQATYTSPSVAKVDTSGPRVTGIASQQSGGGAGNGQLEVGDKLILTFNQNLAPASVPASFTGATEISPSQFANITLNVPGVTSGDLNTGSPFYLASPFTTATFAGNVALSNAAINTTVTLTVTSLGGAATAASSGPLVFAPASTIKDGGGNAAAGSFTTASGFQLF